MNSTRRGKGFTLIELLLAVAISAFLLTVTYTFFSAVERTGKAALENSRIQSTVTPLFYLLQRDIESINTGYGGITYGKDPNGKLNWVEFYTENCYYFPGVCRVRYWTYKSEEGKESWLIRTELRLNSTTNAGVDAPVSSAVTGFKVYHLSGGDWVEGAGGKLLKIVIEMKGGKELPLVFVVRT